MMKLIDISKHNTVTDWAKIKAWGIDGVIIRAGYGRLISQKDKTFESYYAGAVAAGLHVGAYWYSYASTAAEAKVEATVFLEAVKGKKFDLPLYFDIEEEKHVALGKTVCTNIVNAFCGTVEAAGYYVGVYSFDSFFASNLTADIQTRYTCWVAKVGGSKPTCCTKYDLWQYSWAFNVSGITAAVDADYCYKDFPSLIKSAGLNGYTKNTTYSITARMANMNKDNAVALANACGKMGMTVIMAEE